ncbi:unnamed protein product [Acanthosepion pharaonis]|uniref:Uncharacterized protein n=1 Tax=Acanthosepion pharaonis TaxID=158019 RepID=A0A812CXH7_ACAPH|nr:unnamed protein product [Sepia pharaonis]
MSSLGGPARKTDGMFVYCTIHFFFFDSLLVLRRTDKHLTIKSANTTDTVAIDRSNLEKRQYDANPAPRITNSTPAHPAHAAPQTSDDTPATPVQQTRSGKVCLFPQQMIYLCLSPSRMFSPFPTLSRQPRRGSRGPPGLGRARMTIFSRTTNPFLPSIRVIGISNTLFHLDRSAMSEQRKPKSDLLEVRHSVFCFFFSFLLLPSLFLSDQYSLKTRVLSGLTRSRLDKTNATISPLSDGRGNSHGSILVTAPV